MMTIVIVFIVIFAVLHELFGLTASLEKLYYKGELDKVLVEPGEEITLYHSVVNQSTLWRRYMRMQSARKKVFTVNIECICRDIESGKRRCVVL